MELEQLRQKFCTSRNCKYGYGTAGFRDKAEILDTVMFTTGLVACLRSLALQGKAVGVMITASHNPPADNGVKIVEPDGSMLPESWEPLATEFANNAANLSDREFALYLQEKLQEYANDSITPRLIVGRDSRESGPHLLDCLLAGAQTIMHANIVNHGLLTTPQLHFLTSLHNQSIDSAEVTESSYYSFFQKSWESLLALHSVPTLPLDALVIDTANGIGGPKVEQLLASLAQRKQFSIINSAWTKTELLNFECGADFVKTNQKLPKGIDTNNITNFTLHCSFDGDADRVVFYYNDQKTGFHLLDGDKIATLFARFIVKLLKDAKLDSQLSMGVIQTAYANGSSTEYLSKVLQVPVSCTKTGVKHLHHEATTKYDIGIYFEANGHGTVVFSEQFQKVCQEVLQTTSEPAAVKTLLGLSKLINQTVGDAISDMLGVLAVLCIMKITPEQWNDEYTDLPNLLTKVVVPDRSVFVTTDQERRLVSPEGLQAKIDLAVSQVSKGRSFVRASGTEDAVRIYTEAATQEEASQLSQTVTKLVLAAVTH